MLATDSYSSSSQSAIQNSIFQFPSSSSLQCFPCVDPLGLTLPNNSASSAHPASAITSFAFQFDKPFSYDLLRKSLDEILYNNGSNDTKIYRMKGIIHTSSSNQLYVLQAVYNLFELEESSSYSNNDHEDRKSRIIVIGFNLDAILLEKKFESCLL